MKRIRSNVRAHITIEINPGDTWGAECPVDQVFKQGAESAKAQIEKLIDGRARVIECKIVAVLVEEDK